MAALATTRAPPPAPGLSGGRHPGRRGARFGHRARPFRLAPSAPAHSHRRPKLSALANDDDKDDADGILEIYARAAAARRPDNTSGGSPGAVVKVGGKGCALGLAATWSLAFSAGTDGGFCDEVVLDTGESAEAPPVCLPLGAGAYTRPLFSST